jgi:hypothetical protein
MVRQRRVGFEGTVRPSGWQRRSHSRPLVGPEKEKYRLGDMRAMRASLLMDRTVARLNIEHYRKLLAKETDEAKRQTVLRLLAEEESKLASTPHD